MMMLIGSLCAVSGVVLSGADQAGCGDVVVLTVLNDVQLHRAHMPGSVEIRH